MLLVLYYYLIIGVAFGFLTTYLLLRKFGNWESLCEDFNKSVGQDDNTLSPKVAVWLIPFIYTVIFSFLWMPFLIYLGSRKA